MTTLETRRFANAQIFATNAIIRKAFYKNWKNTHSTNDGITSALNNKLMRISDTFHKHVLTAITED